MKWACLVKEGSEVFLYRLYLCFKKSPITIRSLSGQSKGVAAGWEQCVGRGLSSACPRLVERCDKPL